jgi:hypothetical protein
MKTSLLLGAAALAFLQVPQFTIPSGKRLPFTAIAPSTDPMAVCDAEGRTGSTQPSAAKQRENTAKNNLWVTGVPTPVEFSDFSALQSAVGNSPNLTTSRRVVEAPQKVTHGTVGEGSLVQLVAYLRDAHIADCMAPRNGKGGESGEAVNCDFIGVKANDLHITMMPLTEPADECDSVTAEMTPHFRPDAWQMLDQQTPTKNPVRVTGTLFFDDSHQPCTSQRKPASIRDPARRAVWEIHPVYALDVCTAASDDKCVGTDNTVWMPYDKWIATHSIDTTITDQSGARASCNQLAGNKPVSPPIPKRGRTE